MAEYELLRANKDGLYAPVGEQMGDDRDAADRRCLELLHETGVRHGLGVWERTRRTKPEPAAAEKPTTKAARAADSAE